MFDTAKAISSADTCCAGGVGRPGGRRLRSRALMLTGGCPAVVPDMILGVVATLKTSDFGLPKAVYPVLC